MTRTVLLALICAVSVAGLTVAPARVAAQSSVEREREEMLRREQERQRQQRLEDHYRQQREQAERATRERNRAVEEGADRARRQYYDTTRGTRSNPPSSRVTPRTCRGTGATRSQCRRWQRLCRSGKRRYCRLHARNC